MSRGRRLEFRPEDAERQLALELTAAGIDYEQQYRYVPGRQYRADFAFPAARLLVEVQGGVYTRQAHGSVSGVLADNERLNLATLHGWSVLRFTPTQVQHGEALSVVEGLLARWASGPWVSAEGAEGLLPPVPASAYPPGAVALEPLSVVEGVLAEHEHGVTQVWCDRCGDLPCCDAGDDCGREDCPRRAESQ